MLESANDYYPFGLKQSASSYDAPAQAGMSYRYGFNGKELDTEFSSNYDYGFRIYNPAIARFLSVDPLTARYPSWSPYPFAMNNVIDGVDLVGLEYYNKSAYRFISTLRYYKVKKVNKFIPC